MEDVDIDLDESLPVPQSPDESDGLLSENEDAADASFESTVGILVDDDESVLDISLKVRIVL